MIGAWYALRTKPHKEISVWQQLVEHELEGFYPRLPANPVNPRARKERPYFPGYLFVHADLEQTGMATFDYMPHAIGLVRFGGEPGVVPNQVIERMRLHLAELYRTDYRRESHIRPGATVRIQDGPLEGYQAILDHHLPGRERVRVLLELISGRNMAVELGRSSIEPIRGGSVA